MSEKKIVIIIHALASSKINMIPIARFLAKKNCVVFNWDYKSRKFTIEQLAEQLKIYLIQNKIQNLELNFITHSLGGIILRYFATIFSDLKIKNVVMLSPPNNGSELVDVYSKYFWFRKFLGPAACQIGTDINSIFSKITPVKFNLGIIMGNVSLDPISSTFLPSDNDGKVTIQSSKLPEMKEHNIISASHIFIIFSKEAMNLSYNFILNGSFQKN